MANFSGGSATFEVSSEEAESPLARVTGEVRRKYGVKTYTNIVFEYLYMNNKTYSSWLPILVAFIITGSILYYQLAYAQRKIPLRVFQTWHTHDLPPMMRQCVEQMRDQNPEFEFELCDDQECRDFLVKYFDSKVVEAYDRLVPGAFKADLWRYCVLYIHGGVYMDIKYKCVGDFRLYDLVKSTCWCGCRKDTWIYENDPLLVYTGLLIRPPKCPKMWNCIWKIVENVQTNEYGRTFTSPTGPDLLGNFFLEKERKYIRDTSRKDKGRLLYYYDDKSGTNNTKCGHIQCAKTGKILLSHYPEYRVEQTEYGNTEYWIDLWFQRKIYKSSAEKS